MKDNSTDAYHIMTDDKLLGLLADQNKQAFRVIYSRYWDRLYLHAWKVLKNNKICEDVVQEVFIDLWQKDSYEHIENFKAYIYKAVKFKTLMALRNNRITDQHLEVFKSIIPSHTTNQQIRTTELREELIHHLNQLPPRCREVFYKSRFEHFNNQEIADQLNISKRTVETHISHALRYLKGVKELLIILIWIGW